MKEDFLKDKTVIYRGGARLKGTPSAALICLTALVILCVLAFNLVSKIPYSVFLKAAILIFAAISINYILKQGTFSVTYAVTEDLTLVYITKYGSLERETAWIDLTKAEIREKYILFDNKKYEFFPDEELKELLKERL